MCSLCTHTAPHNSLLCPTLLLDLSSDIGVRCCWRRRRARHCRWPLADPASTSKAKVGRPSTSEARAAASSLTCGPGSVRRPGRVPGGGVFGLRGATSSASRATPPLSSSTVQNCGGGLQRGPCAQTSMQTCSYPGPVPAHWAGRKIYRPPGAGSGRPKRRTQPTLRRGWQVRRPHTRILWIRADFNLFHRFGVGIRPQQVTRDVSSW